MQATARKSWAVFPWLFRPEPFHGSPLLLELLLHENVPPTLWTLPRCTEIVRHPGAKEEEETNLGFRGLGFWTEWFRDLRFVGVGQRAE